MTHSRLLSDTQRSVVAQLHSSDELRPVREAIKAELMAINENCEWAIRVGSPRIDFRSDLVEAVCVCVLMARQKRTSELRRELTRLSQRAQAAAAALDRLRDAITSVAADHRDLLFDELRLGDTTDSDWVLATIAPAPELVQQWRRLASGAQRLGNSLKDRGGPQPFLGFKLLVLGLADAFGRATNRPAAITWDAHRERYRGRFWDLVELVRPIAGAIATRRGTPLPQPATDQARGKFIERVLQRMDITAPSTF